MARNISGEGFPEFLASVIIPHKGRPDDLARCLVALADQSISRSSYEVIVVLNSAESADSPKNFQNADKTVYSPHFYSYSARNSGLDQARSDVLAFTDSDTVPDFRWLERGLLALDDEFDLLAGRIELHGSRKFPIALYDFQDKMSFRQDLYVQKGMAITANLFVKVSVFEKTGRFDSRAISGEDLRWTHRAIASGLKISYSKESIVRHRYRNARELFSKAIRTGLADHSSRPVVSASDRLASLLADKSISIDRKLSIITIWVSLHLTTRLARAFRPFHPSSWDRQLSQLKPMRMAGQKKDAERLR